ncbi:hypothetical protein [Anaerocolumna xylanovorans]|uniref:hypothetical protein n=1 Tax=Anaerocolumna xylanovorans TaxID=100134 RepID=UPI0015880BF7|nr:hypothetical protein [Anaerocolumna xylanovorans]
MRILEIIHIPWSDKLPDSCKKQIKYIFMAVLVYACPNLADTVLTSTLSDISRVAAERLKNVRIGCLDALELIASMIQRMYLSTQTAKLFA